MLLGISRVFDEPFGNLAQDRVRPNGRWMHGEPFNSQESGNPKMRRVRNDDVLRRALDSGLRRNDGGYAVSRFSISGQALRQAQGERLVLLGISRVFDEPFGKLRTGSGRTDGGCMVSPLIPRKAGIRKAEDKER